MARPGVKPKLLDPLVRAKVLTALKTMVPVAVAARCAGVERRTVDRWLEKAKNPRARRIYRTFAEEVEKAEAEAEVLMAGTIAAKSRTEWTAAAWLLERKYPERWGRRERFEMSGPGGGPVLVSDPIRAGLADPEIRAALALAAHRMTAKALGEGQGEIIEGSAVKIVEGAAVPEPSNGTGGQAYPETDE